MKGIIENVIKAICIMLYFFVLNLAYTRMNLERLVYDIQFFAGIYLVLGILFLEKAYREDNGNIVLTSIELFILSFHSLSIIHITNILKIDYKSYIFVSFCMFTIYYILKVIIIYTLNKRKTLNELSDISEIVKKDEPVKKVATKKNVKKGANKK